MLSVVDPLLVISEGVDALDSLDAWMAALNLVRFLLTRANAAPANTAAATAAVAAAPDADAAAAMAAAAASRAAHVALPAAAVTTLRRERLQPLDNCVRRRMDVLWAEVGAAEAQSGGSGGGGDGSAAQALSQMRMSFTHLHVAADVSTQALEVCGRCAAAGAGAA